MAWLLIIIGFVLGAMVDASVMGAVLGAVIGLSARVSKLEAHNAKLREQVDELERRGAMEAAGVPALPMSARARTTERSPGAPVDVTPAGARSTQPSPVTDAQASPFARMVSTPVASFVAPAAGTDAFAATSDAMVNAPRSLVGPSVGAGPDEPRAFVEPGVDAGSDGPRPLVESSADAGSDGPRAFLEPGVDAGSDGPRSFAGPGADAGSDGLRSFAGPGVDAGSGGPRSFVGEPAELAGTQPREVDGEHEPAGPDSLDRALAAARAWLVGGNPVLRIGVLLLFLGLAFLLRYAAERGMVPIELRYAGVAGTGAALLGLGGWLRRRNPAYALILQGTGVAVLYLTVFAAIRLHGLISPTLGLGLLVAVTIGSAALAVVQNALALAVVAAIGGFAAPVLASSGGGNHVALFSYLAVLNAGIFAIAWFKAWRQLNMVGFVGTFGIGLAWGLRSYEPALFASTQPFLALFFLMYVGIGLLFARRKLRDAADAPAGGRAELLRWSASQTDYVDGTVMFGPPMVGFGLQYAVVAHLPYGPAISAATLGVFYVGLAWLLAGRSAGRVLLLVETYLALGVVFMTLAVPLALDARWTSAAWAVEGAGLYWLGLRQGRPLARMFALLVQAGAALAFLGEVRGGGLRTLLDGPPLGALMLGASLLFVHDRLRRAPEGVAAAWERSWCPPLLASVGLAFTYLIAPLCFAVDMTVIAWALAGLVTAVVGMHLRSYSYLLLAAGVQVLAGWLMLVDLVDPQWMSDGLMGSGWRGTGVRVGPPSAVGLRPLAHGGFWAPATLAVAALLGAWQLHRGAERLAGLRALSHGLVIWGGAWWGLTALLEVDRFVPAAWQGAALLGIAGLSAALWAEAAVRSRWPALALLSLTLTPVAAVVLNSLLRADYEPFARLGWLGWLVVLAAHLTTLRRVAALVPGPVLAAAHVLGCWLLLGVLTLELRSLAQTWTRHDSAWPWVIVALVPAMFLLLMASPRRLVWPVSEHPRAYRGVAAVTVAVALLGWFWAANVLCDGDVRPLLYVPIFNPLELGLLLALFAVRRAASTGLPLVGVPAGASARPVTAVLGASLFALCTAAVFRGAHHLAGVPYEVDALLGSMLVQAGLSIVWTTIALGLMVAGHLRGGRVRWSVGAALIGVVVVKLFLVELGNTGGLARIISFIGVGVLLLVVGYFAPLPPRRKA